MSTWVSVVLPQVAAFGGLFMGTSWLAASWLVRRHGEANRRRPVRVRARTNP